MRHASQSGAGGRSPSDLPLVRLSQGEIEYLERQYPQIEDVLPLSPLQEGLLFHALYDAHARDVYTVQLELDLAGALDSTALQSAVQALVGRHASLRAGFWHERLSRPVQIIVPQVAVPWRKIDLSLLEETQREQQLTRLLSEERTERFDLTAPPLMRFMLIRLAADQHRLVLTNHHLLMDGWSAPVLVRELLTLYAHKGDDIALSRAPSYRDYLAFIAAQDRAASIAFWQEALAGVEEATRVAPPDRGHTPVAPEQVAVSLGEQLTRSLELKVRKQALTLNTVIQVAWAILLGRLTGRNDVVFGVTVAGRPAEIAGIEGMVGLFINTLPLRIKLPPEKSLHDLLQEMQDSQSKLIAHQYLGLTEIQQVTGLGELFDTLMVFENYPVDHRSLSADADGIRLANVRGYDATHYPLSLTVQPGEQLQLRFDYRPDLFDRGSVEALGGRLVRLLDAVVADSSRALGSLEILSASERHRILVEWNDTAHPLSPATLPDLFSAQAARSPEAVAVVCADRRLSYAALEAQANQLAHHLRGLGVGPESVVGLCLERSPEMVVGLLGILKAGGAYLPLDPGYPVERLAFMLADAGAPVLVTQSALLERLRPPAGTRIVRLDSDAPHIAQQPATAPPHRLDPHNPAYVIYTSGSTGTPKGVVVEHRHIVASNSARSLFYDLPSPRFLLLSSIAFDSSIVGIFWSLLSGGTLVLPASLSVDAALSSVLQHEVNCFLAVPSLYDALIDHLHELERTELRTVILAGQTYEQ